MENDKLRIAAELQEAYNRQDNQTTVTTRGGNEEQAKLAKRTPNRDGEKETTGDS